MHESKIIVPDLCCATEELKIRKKFDDVGGVNSLHVNFIARRLSVTHTITADQLLQALRDIGLPGSLESSSQNTDRSSHLRRQRLMFYFSVGFFLFGVVCSIIDSTSELLSTAFYLLCILASGWLVAHKGWKSLVHRTLDINVLMSVAVLGAVAIGKYQEGATVILLYAASLLLESMSMDRTRDAIRSLMHLSPLTATVLQSGHEAIVSSDRIAVGDIVRIHPGERIPADGIVINGASSVDQSAITGESVPVAKSTHDTVFAGTFNLRGVLEYRVEKPAHDSRLAQIVHLVEEAESKRSERHSFIEVFARVYTPAVFALALVVWLLPPLFLNGSFQDWFYRGLVLLVISCPCAFVISTPITLVSAITNAARHGLLIKGGRHLETLSRIRAIALDKTGTVTQAKLAVTDVLPLGEMLPTELIRIAASLELKSEHHLADALLSKAAQMEIEFRFNTIEAFESIPGKGIQAVVNGRRFALGNHAFAEERGICSPKVEKRLDVIEMQGKTAIILADEHQALGIIAFVDTMRSESRDAVASFHHLGIRPIVLLTGDNASIAKATAEELGVDEYRAGLLPGDKSEAVKDLRIAHGTVAMIGDGVNDAPALAAADIGIAMGGAGSDTAIETADVVLLSDNLSKIPHGILLGKKALSIIRQNIFLALAVKGVFLLLGVIGWTSLWLAILADDGVTLIVILNSLRALRFEIPG
jgi:Cd2+/Zn2+-exporting ATPase